VENIMIKAVLFDLGDTLIYERVDDIVKLDEMTLHIRPHAKETLERLSGYFQIGLVSDTETSPELSVRKALNKLGIEAYFSAIVTSTNIGVSKPHAKIFLEALKRLNVGPQEAVMVGNDPSRDILGAKQLGISTILYRTSRYYYKGAEENADYFIDSLDELFDIITGF
jgi:HAD superfamily hydrolase (TIGR01509 family)